MREYLNKVNITGDNIQGNDTVTAGEFNSIAKELKNVLVSADIPFGDINPAGEDIIQNQLATAIFNIAQRANWWTDESLQENEIILSRSDSIIYSSLPFAGQRISWINSIQNTGATTIKVGIYDAIPLKTLSGQDLTIQTLSNNMLYNAVYDGTFWRLDGISSVILTGVIYMGEDQGDSLYCDGAEISRITYARLFAKIGTKYGVGDGLNTFNLPNYTNRVPRGAGSLIAIGEKQEDDFKSHSHPINDIKGTFDSTRGEIGGRIIHNGTGGFIASISESGDTAFTLKENTDDLYPRTRTTFSSHRAGVTATNNAGGTETRVKALGTDFWIFI